MRRLSVERTPTRLPIDISTRAPIELAPTLKINSTQEIRGRERFTKTPEVQDQIKKAMSREIQTLLNPNMRRSGCRCVDKNDPEPTLPPCKSRFCEKKRVKSQFGKKDQGKDRSMRKGALIRLPGRSSISRVPKPSVEAA